MRTQESVWGYDSLRPKIGSNLPLPETLSRLRGSRKSLKGRHRGWPPLARPISRLVNAQNQDAECGEHPHQSEGHEHPAHSEPRAPVAEVLPLHVGLPEA